MVMDIPDLVPKNATFLQRYLYNFSDMLNTNFKVYEMRFRTDGVNFFILRPKKTIEK